MWFIIVALLCSLLGDGSGLQVFHRRSRTFINQITLTCNSVNGRLSNALFFLDGTALEQRVNVARSGASATFHLTTSLEGNFTCSSSTGGVQSGSLQLVFLPTTNIVLPTQPTVYAQIGSTATLNCGLFPGRLVQFYNAMWTNGSQLGQVYDRTNSISSPVISPQTLPSRYSIDPVTFALSIRNVTLSDTDLTYRCVVDVFNPNTQVTRRYQQTRTLNIRLVVYKPPTIIQKPEPQTLSLKQSLQVRYTCIAVGDPAPQITWTHNGMATASLTQYHTVNTQPVADKEGRGFIVSSTLSIFPLDEISTGNVSCTARVPPASLQDADDQIPSTKAFARLSVLGGFKDVGVLITQGGDIIFKLTLPKVINVPVQVLMVYSNENAKDDNNDFSQANRTTATSFNNTDAITHIVFSSKLPYKVFRVGVALVSGSAEGPVQNHPRVHNVDSPSLVSTSLLQSQLIVASLVPTIFFILLFIAVIAITAIIHFNRRKKRELEFHRSIIDRHADVLEILLDKLPEDPSGRVYLHMLSVVERILTVHLEEGSPHPSETESRISILDEVDLPEMSIKSSALIRTLGNVIEKGRRDPKLRPHLDRQMSTIILDQPDNNFHVLGQVDAMEDLDHGYAGSHSASTKEELEHDQEL